MPYNKTTYQIKKLLSQTKKKCINGVFKVSEFDNLN